MLLFLYALDAPSLEGSAANVDVGNGDIPWLLLAIFLPIGIFSLHQMINRTKMIEEICFPYDPDAPKYPNGRIFIYAIAISFFMALGSHETYDQIGLVGFFVTGAMFCFRVGFRDRLQAYHDFYSSRPQTISQETQEVSEKEV